MSSGGFGGRSPKALAASPEGLGGQSGSGVVVDGSQRTAMEWKESFGGKLHGEQEEPSIWFP